MQSARTAPQPRKLQPNQGPANQGPRELPVNRWPVNQLARRRLLEAAVSLDPHLPYLVQLLQRGFEANLAVPGQGQRYWDDLNLAADQLSDPNLNPSLVMRWLLSNRNGGDQKEQNWGLSQLLEQAPNWEVAAQKLMEWFYDLKASQDPYFRPAPNP